MNDIFIYGTRMNYDVPNKDDPPKQAPLGLLYFFGKKPAGVVFDDIITEEAIAHVVKPQRFDNKFRAQWRSKGRNKHRWSGG